MNPSHNKIKKK